MTDTAQQAADEMTNARFGKAMPDPIIGGIGGAVTGWLITLLAFLVSSVPERMVGYTPDIMAGICGVAVFSYFHWRNSRRSRFWAEAYARHSQQKNQ